MAMSGPALAAALKAAIISSYGGPPANDAELTNFCNALGNTIVSYIQENAIVEPGSMNAGGVPVAGTGTVE